MADIDYILKQYWGYNAFHSLQKEIITDVLQGKDVLALLPTGGGKSICYQIPALAKDGCCLVISPLIALMQDQLQKLKQVGISAVAIHSGMHYYDVKRHLENATQGAYKLLYVSPERLQTNLFNEYISEIDINLIAVDEAHCISQWGHDFRPDYLKIASLKKLFADTPFIALTASATKEVQQDIQYQLQLNNPSVYKQSFRKENLYYEIAYTENKINDTVNELQKTKGSKIVYCRSRRQTELISKTLVHNNLPALHYHAGLAKNKRDETQESWTVNKTPIVVATTAFGMGIDKADVRMVLHYDAPEHLEAYYQEIGRAGRDANDARCLLVWNNNDIKNLQDSIATKFPDEAFLRKVYQAVCEHLQLPIGVQPDTYFDFEIVDFCKKFSLPTLQTHAALKLLEQEGLWTISDSVFKQATVEFIVERNVLDDFLRSHPLFSTICLSLLRLFGTVFNYPTGIRLQDVARQSKMKTEDVEKTLEQLHQIKIINFKKATDKPQLYFHHLRVDSRHLYIDTKRIAILRDRHRLRTEKMIEFITNETVCREKMLLQYFDEIVQKDCGHCDICTRKKTSNAGETELRKTMLELIINNEYSINTLVAHFPMHQKQQVLAMVRMLLDEERLSLQNGLLSMR